ncbi:hypothetical protein D3C80_1233860 [compost metagenome]
MNDTLISANKLFDWYQHKAEKLKQLGFGSASILEALKKDISDGKLLSDAAPKKISPGTKVKVLDSKFPYMNDVEVDNVVEYKFGLYANVKYGYGLYLFSFDKLEVLE